VELVRKHGPALSFDLIFAAPGSTLQTWAADLDEALRFGPRHLSTYGLTYEKGTPLWKRRGRGLVRPVGEDDELAMYEHAIDRLAAAGFEHYEISNFARPGNESLHNLKYWKRQPYFGFGLDAHSMLLGRDMQAVRTWTTDDLEMFLSSDRRIAGSEHITDAEALAEQCFLGLRLREGIDWESLAPRVRAQDPAIDEKVDELIAAGLAQRTGRTLLLTSRGRLLSNEVFERFLATEGLFNIATKK